MVLRVSEVYASVQGEGPRTGQTTVFVRFGGCNLRCPGWPCDTQHAIDPAYRNEWERIVPDDLVKRIDQTASISGAKLITLTGGEPFLQPKKDLGVLVNSLTVLGYKVEAFTNGTIEYPEWAVENVHMIMDWKLPGSGEDTFDTVRRKNIVALDESSNIHAVKFVCKDMNDLSTAISLWSLLPEKIQHSFIWYYGRVWNAEMTNAKMIEAVLKNKLNWRLNVQLHNYIWPANERGR